MNKLQWTAVIGLSTGIVALGLGAAAGFGDILPEALAAISGQDTGCSADSRNATATERRWAWDGSDSVEIALPANVHYRAGEGTEVIARGPASELAEITVECGRIGWDCRRSSRSHTIDITLPGREYRTLRLNGSGTVTMEKLAQPALDLSINGSGQMRAQGAIDQLKAQVNGSGDVHFGDLAVKQLEIRINGSGNAEAKASERADVTIAGSGDVHLLNHPASVQSRIMGSGRIIQD